MSRTYDDQVLYDQLARFTGGEEVRSRNGKYECHISCPACGHSSRKGYEHFSFSRYGYRCFSCGYSGYLPSLAQKLGFKPDSTAPRRERKNDDWKPAPPRRWQADPMAWVDRYTSAFDTVTHWQKYKPFSLDSILRWRLGIGVLPSCACQHRRLIYPVIVDGRVVALRGRRLNCDCQKWKQAAGSDVVLFNEQAVTPGCVVVIVESPVDVMLCSQYALPTSLPVIPVAGTAGAGTFKDEWIERLAVKKPAAFLVWLDNDLAGTPSADIYPQLVTEWRAKHPDAKNLPIANGPALAERLATTRIPTKCHQWPRGTPAKVDLSWLLAQRKQAA
jgi:hypothetical protein